MAEAVPAVCGDSDCRPADLVPGPSNCLFRRHTAGRMEAAGRHHCYYWRDRRRRGAAYPQARLGAPGKVKRFWKSAEVIDVEGNFAIELDGRPVKTPARANLAVPTRALAEAIAAE